MLKVTLICVGSLKEAYWRQAAAEYEKRLSVLCKLQTVELAEARLPAEPSEREISAALEAESKRIIDALPRDAVAAALCVEGVSASSEQLAARLDKAMNGGASHIALIIGSSHGLAETVKAHAAVKLSLSALTLPHQLAHIVVLEQLYRVRQIQTGGAYHK